MIRYVLAILLVTCYNSLGNPVKTTSKQISASIIALENNCGNVFVKSLLKSKINECSDFAPPYKTKQLQCLMFYDMSTQLCTAVNTTGLTLNDDYTSTINEEADVNTLCETTKDWIFTDHLEYHSYKHIIEKIFKHPVTCGKICGSEELTSDDANFYCKFYKWGWEAIKNHLNTVSQDNNNVSAVAQSQPNPNKPVDPVHSSNESLDISIKSTTSNDKPKESEPSSVPLEKVNNTNNVDTIPIQNVPEDAIINKEASPLIDTTIKKSEETQGIIKTKETSIIAQEIAIPPSNGKVAKEVLTKVSTVPLIDSGKKEIKIEPEEKESVLENPKDKVLIDSDHYVDDDFNSEDGKEGNDDLQGDDDGGDPVISDNIKPSEKKTKIENKIESEGSSFNKEISPREFFSGNAQDVGDHFFTFFLTAVVLIVLLYILYHDKSKISKLFFGLLVEGRQGGRRRNSRGHAYRRLDTLEQAMSTNTTAPPSKIIY